MASEQVETRQESEQLDLFGLGGAEEEAPVSEPSNKSEDKAEQLPPKTTAAINEDLVKAVAQQVVAQLQPVIPATVAQAIEAEKQREQLRREFYEQNPDLKGRDLVVGAIAEKYLQLHPDASKEEAFKAIAEASREYLKGPETKTSTTTQKQLVGDASPAPTSEGGGDSEIGQLVEFAKQQTIL